MNMYIPVIIVVLSNTVYHICSKSTPQSINPFASLSITYLVSALVCGIIYFTTTKNPNLFQEYRQLNWSSFALGIAIVGLEAGFLYMYKAGWNISAGQLVASALVSLALLIVGYLMYHEAVTLTKLAGIAVCLFGLYLINK